MANQGCVHDGISIANERETVVTGATGIIQLNKLTIALWRKEGGLRRVDFDVAGSRGKASAGLFEMRLEGAGAAQFGKDPRPERGDTDRRGAAGDDRRDGAEGGGHRPGPHLAELV